MAEISCVIEKTLKDHIRLITMNRPAVMNALNAEMIVELSRAITAANNDPAIKVILLGANGKHFSAGADLNWMKNSAKLSFEDNQADARALATLLEQLYETPKPVVIAVQGNAYGGALGLISCGDIVLTTKESLFCFSEVKLGLVPAVISPYVIHAIGQRDANSLFLTARIFNGTEAKSISLVHQLVDYEQLQVAALKQCQDLLLHGSLAMQSCKELVRNVAPINREVANDTVDLIAQLRSSREGQEGLAAFLEKRKPNWDSND